jgi:predicted small lipoprotein YifL
MRNSIGTTIMLLLSIVFLSACGQKGPLFLPGNPSTLQTIPSAEQLREEADAQDEDDEEEETEINPR